MCSFAGLISSWRNFSTEIACEIGLAMQDHHPTVNAFQWIKIILVWQLQNFSTSNNLQYMVLSSKSTHQYNFSIDNYSQAGESTSNTTNLEAMYIHKQKINQFITLCYTCMCNELFGTNIVMEKGNMYLWPGLQNQPWERKLHYVMYVSTNIFSCDCSALILKFIESPALVVNILHC